MTEGGYWWVSHELVSPTCQKLTIICFFHGQASMAQQIVNGDPIENKKKFMQFVTIFHLLKQR